MKKLLKKLLIMTFILAVAAGCSSGTSKTEGTENSNQTSTSNSAEGESKIITVAAANANPWSLVDESGKNISGPGIDIIDEVLSRMGYKADYIITDIQGTFGNIDSGRADMNGVKLTSTPDRKEKYDMSDVYFYDLNYLAVRKDDDSINSIKDLKGKTVAVGAGQDSLEFFEEYKKQNDPNDEIKLLIVNDGIMDAVTAGQADACLQSEPFYSVRNKNKDTGLKIVGEPLKVDESAFVFKKGMDPEFIAEFNKALQSMKDDGWLSQKYIDAYDHDASKPQ